MPVVKNVNFAECDGNGCQVSTRVQGDELPPGWIRIQIADVGGEVARQPAFVLHSLQCVERWAKGRRAMETAAARANLVGYHRTSRNGDHPEADDDPPLPLSPQARLGLTPKEQGEFNKQLALDCFRQTPDDEFTVPEIATLIEANETTARRCIRALIEGGQIVQSHQGKSGPGNPSRYRLRIPEPAIS